MRYRQLSPTGDYSFGRGTLDFYVDRAEAVSQAVVTRLRLMQAEWFLDVTDGTPYNQIVGTGTQGTRDLAVRERVLGTQGVVEILSYQSSVADRGFSVIIEISTIYGPTTVQQVI